MEQATWLRFDAHVVVHSSANPLLAAQIAFGCLHGNVTEKESDLVQFATRCKVTVSCMNVSDHAALHGGARVLWRTVSQRARRLVSLRRYPRVCRPADTSEQSAGLYSGCSRPQVDGGFDSLGHGHGSNVTAFADQINYGPMFLALL
jgi:hypothetical protein